MLDNREGIQPESMKPPAYRAGRTSRRTARRCCAGDPPMEPLAPDEGEQPAGFFAASNLVMLGLLAGVTALFLLTKFAFDELLNIGKAALGLSFVIFIHELGHFMAAKWCGVNVTTFSIGFGPAIPGCKFTWGETTYKLSILPLGGYVQMVGHWSMATKGTDDNTTTRWFLSQEDGAATDADYFSRRHHERHSLPSSASSRSTWCGGQRASRSRSSASRIPTRPIYRMRVPTQAHAS